MSDTTYEQAAARAQRLRDEIRHFCAHVMPADLRRKSERHQVLDKADYLQWMRLLQRQGWVVGHWPEAHGGAGWSALERFVFEDELARHGCPWVIPFGVKYVGPVIYTYGSEAQKQRFLPRIVSSEEFWARYRGRFMDPDMSDGDRWVEHFQAPDRLVRLLLTPVKR